MFRRASASLRNSLIQTAVRGFSGSASHQVLVVGGGPGGLSVASSLLRKGLWKVEPPKYQAITN